jgi:hypothetical protein
MAAFCLKVELPNSVFRKRAISAFGQMGNILSGGLQAGKYGTRTIADFIPATKCAGDASNLFISCRPFGNH